jgi:protease-4
MATVATPPPRRRHWLLVLSLLANLVLLVLLVLVLVAPSSDSSTSDVIEKHYSGERSADNKVAIIHVSGVLMEGRTAFPLHEIKRAAKDKNVKAVVVRIDSPGGTITASEDLHRALVHLRDNTHTRFEGTGPKPLVASMGSIAASGGYYIATPASKIVAERTTITGAIGVFAALPNVAELAHNHGVKVELIKAGDIKASGSPWQTMTPDERQPWQDMVNHAYDRFLDVVAEGRLGLDKQKLVADKQQRQIPKYDDKGNPLKGPDGKPVMVTVSRYRADGGTYTPPQAKELGLIDDIADLPTAVRLAAEAAGLTHYRAVSYTKQKSLVEQVLGMELRQPAAPLSAEALAAAATPRLWYLAPGYDVTGALTSSPAP